jgi:hypothetical protein
MSKAIQEAEKALASANKDYLDELERDSKRRDGSGAQERRREERLDSFREDVYQKERALEALREKGA